MNSTPGYQASRYTCSPTSRPETQPLCEGDPVLMVLRLACLMAATLDTPLLSPFW